VVDFKCSDCQVVIFGSVLFTHPTARLYHYYTCFDAVRQVLLVQRVAMLSCMQYFAILKREKDTCFLLRVVAIVDEDFCNMATPRF